MMRTMSEMFEVLTNWHQWNGANHRARDLDAEGCHASAEKYRALRDQRTVDAIDVLASTEYLIGALAAGRLDVIAEARRRGNSWERIGQAMNRSVDDVHDEYAAIVDRLPCLRRPGSIDLA